MKHVIGNSGGETSGMLTHIIMNDPNINKDDVIISFQNTSDEDYRSYQFIRNQELMYKKDFVWLEYDFPKGFADKILKLEPTYQNLEKCVKDGTNFAGMYNLDVLDKIKWREGEEKLKVKVPKNLKSKAKKDDKDLEEYLISIGATMDEYIESVRDFSRCEKDFYALFNCTRSTQGSRHKTVSFDTANKEGIVFLKVMLYLNAIRYVKQLPCVVPNAAQRFSTGYLKVKTLDSYLRSIGLNKLGDKREYCKYIGIRKDEPSRYFGLVEDNGGVKMPLYDLGITSADVKSFWDKMPFQLEIRDRKYLGNCVDCYLKTNIKRIRACQESPVHFWRRNIIEQAAGDSMKRSQSVAQIIEDAKTKVITNEMLGMDQEKEMSCTCG